MNLLLTFFMVMLKTSPLMWCPHAAADDRKVPPGRIFTGPASGYINRGEVGTNRFKNFLFSIALPFADAICGKKFVDGIFTRTTPVGDSDWEAMPKGSFAVFLTVASKVVTDAAYYIHTIDGYTKVITGGGDNTIDAIATTARAGTRWDGLRLKSKVPTGVTCAGEQTGLYIETEVTGTGIVSGVHYGLKVETYVESTATLSSDHYGAGIFTYDNRAGSNKLHVLRLEHNGANVGNAFLGLFNAAGKISYFLETSATTGWINLSQTASPGAYGWIKIKIGGATKYIALCDTAS